MTSMFHLLLCLPESMEFTPQSKRQATLSTFFSSFFYLCFSLALSLLMATEKQEGKISTIFQIVIIKEEKFKVIWVKIEDKSEGKLLLYEPISQSFLSFSLFFFLFFSFSFLSCDYIDCVVAGRRLNWHYDVQSLDLIICFFVCVLVCG